MADVCFECLIGWMGKQHRILFWSNEDSIEHCIRKMHKLYPGCYVIHVKRREIDAS